MIEAHSDIISRVECYPNFVVFERGESTLKGEYLDVRTILYADSQVFEY